MVNIHNCSLQQDTVLSIGKFAILWNIFEREKCNNYCTVSKIEKLIFNTSDKWHQLAEVLKQRQEQFDLTEEQYITRKLRRQGLNSERIEKINKFLQSNGQEDIVGGLFAIYRIRNNMFHGEKDYQMLDGQKELFDAVNNVLESILRDN